MCTSSEIGAPHVLEPERLESSARRLYGDAFDVLWGELAPVPAENVEVAGERVVGLDCFPSPGHAEHHVCYLHSDGTLYAGDAAGVRIQPGRHVLPVCPPPEVDVEGWFRTFEEIEQRRPERLALIHFGVAESPSEHLAIVREQLAKWAERGREGLDEQAWVAAARRDLEAAVGEDGRPLGARGAALAVLRRDEAVLGQEGRSGRLGPFHERQFRLLFAARAVSFLGSAMAPIALAFAVLDLTGSTADLGYVLAARAAPAGRLHPRRRRRLRPAAPERGDGHLEPREHDDPGPGRRSPADRPRRAVAADRDRRG